MNEVSDFTLTENFKRYFKVVLALTEADKRLVYQVRYRVYCEEFKYEAVDLFPDGLETDEYDHIARHCLVIHRRTGMPAGCVRLVPAIGELESNPLPLEKYCFSALDAEMVAGLALQRSSVCEISRLAVDREFRRRSGEMLTRFGEIQGMHLSNQENRSFSLIAVACFLAATAMTEMDGRTNVFAMMEPFLPRLMHRSGIDFKRVGKDMNYHGIRAPYFITTQAALAEMQPNLLSLYQWIKQNIILE